MATITTSVEAFDALGNRPSFKAEQDSVSGVLTPHHVIETNGLPVSGANPFPVADTAAAVGIGTPADAAWSTGAGSLVALLKAAIGFLATPAAPSGAPSAVRPIVITTTIVPLTSADNQIIPANANRKYLLIVNIGTGLATLGFGVAAVAGQGYPISAAPVAGDQGGGLERSGDGITQQAIHGICATGVTTSVVVLEGV
jgi:hypothetical protein